jgi:hypothetical protein
VTVYEYLAVSGRNIAISLIVHGWAFTLNSARASALWSVALMTSLARIFVCTGAGLVCGRVGLVAGAILLPLAFPLSLPDSSQAENTVMTLMILIAMVFAVGGFVLCWKFTSRWVRD